MFKLKLEDFKFKLTDEQKTQLFGESTKDLSEDDISLSVDLFESAVNVKISAMVDKINESANDVLEEAVNDQVEDIQENVNEYLKYVSKQWVEENKEAIEATLQSKLDARCVAKMQEAFKESFIEIPDERIDLMAQLHDEVTESERKYDKIFDENVQIRKDLMALQKEKIVEVLTAKLTESQKEKVQLTLEHINYEGIEDFGKKAKHIVQNMYLTEDTKENDQNTLDEGVDGKYRSSKNTTFQDPVQYILERVPH